MGSEDEEYERLLDEIDGIANSPQHRVSRMNHLSPTAPFSPSEGDASSGILFSPPADSQVLQQLIDEEDKDEEVDALPVHKILPRWDGKKPSEEDIGDEIEGLLGDLGPTGHGHSADVTAGNGVISAPVCDGSASWDGMFRSVVMGAAEERGQRPSMEDKYVLLPAFMPFSFATKVQGARALAAVFDGHSGAQVASYVASRVPTLLELEPWYGTPDVAPKDVVESSLINVSRPNPPRARAMVRHADVAPKDVVESSLINVFTRVDGEILEKSVSGGLSGGSTACVAVLLENRLFVANLGDSRAVLSRGGTAEALSVDHKPDVPSERERIEALDGKVECRGCWRVMGSAGGAAYRGLAVSRAFGDVDWKVPVSLVESKPEVKVAQLKPDDEFLVIGCDGVWDVLSNQEAVDLARRHVLPVNADGAGPDSGVTERAAEKAAREITVAALERGTMDNVTVVVMALLRGEL
eukprot:CAMPEP_0202854512 /NCGR_PEP_ID=MMETSP1389-20130828/91040_1 /ASSEMBLY_ACC=CAM_ASM_000865 /TAXON_ID=302021 /ORGANISM="Rhodomonas sp., Strain CCMP768" /LENGTH=466 /DNA_ID=CAMNT_0049533105 /DNA_START=63 /DNA_END=1464 /DNA_ORIENTATION=+